MKKQCTLRILDEVNCVFIGLAPRDIIELHKKYAILTDNYFFNPKYKLGAWDGTINYFHKTGKTYNHLLEDIIPRVVNFGYKINVDDLRKPKPLATLVIDENYFKLRGVLDKAGNPWIIRDYQIDLANTLLEHGSGVAIAGTGAGKTSITALLALAYEEMARLRSIIIVPDKNLTDQTYTEYKNFGLDVGQYGGGIKDGDHQHVVSTWQTLKNHPSFLSQFQVIIVDEAHGLKGKVLQDLLTKHASHIPFRFGVTGTLPKGETDKMAVHVAVGPVRYEIPAHELQAQGHLADLHIDIMQTNLDFTDDYQQYLEDAEDDAPVTYKKFVDEFFPDYPSEKRHLQTDKERMQWIADYIMTQHDRRMGNALVLVNGIVFGRKLAELIPGAIFLSGKDSMDVRKAAYAEFQDRDDVTLVATVNIASTGLDIPRIFQLIGIDMGKSFIRVIQSIGRSLRKAHDKDFARFTDICSNLKYSRKHLTERKKYYNEQKYKYKLHKVDL